MKKLLTILLFATQSCSKDDAATCWECELQNTFTGQVDHKTVCNSGELPGPFVDAQGNDVSFFCTKK